MTLWHLVLREIAYRKGNFLLGAASVIVAVGCLVGALVALEGHDLRTEGILSAREAETQERMKKLEDAYRKITKGLGFNVLILPKEQNLADLYAEDYASKYMPEEYAKRLSESNIATINHLLPSLSQKLKWPETQRTILVIGTRGEVPILHRDPKKPLLETVPKGSVVVGYELHRSLDLSEGSQITLLGREFKVTKLHEERGTKDDITLWINLEEAQELLGKKGLINAILALECHCAGDRLAMIRSEIGAILPDTQVIEFKSQALARAEARETAAQEAHAALEAERLHRRRLRDEQMAFASFLVPIALLGCSMWIGFLALGNTRERAAEIGILRTLGLRARDVLWVFLCKAGVMGLGGAAGGYLVGIAFGALWGGVALGEAATLFDWSLFFAVLVCAPLIAMFASWVPALSASRQDPAEVLRD